MEKEAKFYQRFELHMKNGDVVEVYEDYDLPAEKGIIGQFKRGRKKFMEVNDSICGYIIPYDQVSFIVVAGVKKVV